MAIKKVEVVDLVVDLVDVDLDVDLVDVDLDVVLVNVDLVVFLSSGCLLFFRLLAPGCILGFWLAAVLNFWPPAVFKILASSCSASILGRQALSKHSLKH